MKKVFFFFFLKFFEGPFKNNSWSTSNLLFDYVDGINYSIMQNDAPLHKQGSLFFFRFNF